VPVHQRLQEATSPNRAQPDLPLKEIPTSRRKLFNRPVTDLARTGDKEVIDVIQGHSIKFRKRRPSEGNGNGSSTHAHRVTVALGASSWHYLLGCGSDKVIRAGAAASARIGTARV